MNSKLDSVGGEMRAVLATEVLLVVPVSVAIAAGLTAIVGRLGGLLIELLGSCYHPRIVTPSTLERRGPKKR